LGRLVAIGTPEELKLNRMEGQVLEVESADSDRAMRILKEAQRSKKHAF